MAPLKDLRVLMGLDAARPSLDELRMSQSIDLIHLELMVEAHTSHVAAAASRKAAAATKLALNGNGTLPAGHPALHRDAHGLNQLAVDAHQAAIYAAPEGSEPQYHHMLMRDQHAKLVGIHAKRVEAKAG